MGEKIKVSITADMHIHLDKTVEMDKADFDEYQRICSEGIDLDSRIGEIASRYDLNINDSSFENDPENITFEIIK